MRLWTDCICFNRASGMPPTGSPRPMRVTSVPGSTASSTWLSRMSETHAIGIGARAGRSPAWTRVREEMAAFKGVWHTGQ